MILDDILKYREIQLEREKSELSRIDVKKEAEKISSSTLGFKNALKKDKLSIIAEVKKASPSKGVIEPDFRPKEKAEMYEKAGASAISCLTEEHYFMGSKDVFKAVRESVNIPVLRKDFITDPFQIYEARLMGADAVLLIAAVLDKYTLGEYLKIAKSIGLDALCEAHDERELDNVLESGGEIIGINNRNLKTFEVTLDTFKNLSVNIPDDYVKVSESGIKNSDDIKKIISYGANAVLIGETLMRNGSDGIKKLMGDNL